MAREAAIFNVDIRGFSRLAEEIQPTDAIRILSAYQRRVVPIIQRHGGVIDKFMGDGIMAIIAAAVGWLAMIAYVMLADPQDAMITRNYVSYMTGNTILVGAEIGKEKACGAHRSKLPRRRRPRLPGDRVSRYLHPRTRVPELSVVPAGL